jgi:cholesterol oxidase
MSTPGGSVPLRSWSRPAPPSLSFSEHQHGFFGPSGPSRGVGGEPEPTDGIERFRSGYELGIDIGSSLDFTVHIEYEDLTKALSDPSQPAAMHGTVIAPALSKRALSSTGGVFVLLTPDTTQVETSNMTYAMDIRSVEGDEYRIFGFKVIHEGPEWAAWPDSTTLYVTVYRRDGGRTDVIGRGITRVSVGDFANLLGSMRVDRVPGTLSRLRYKARFGRLLGRSLFQHYGGSFAELTRFPVPPLVADIPQPRNWPGTPETYLRSPTRDWYRYTRGGMKDACSRLIRYAGPAQPNGPVVLAPGFGMPSWSLTTHTIDKNLVEYLIDAGYEVWLFDFHSGSDLPSAKTQFTLDTIADDWAHAIEKVAAVTGRKMHCMGHCAGSSTLLMALLNGAPTLGCHVRSIVCGQYSLFPYTSMLNLAKEYLGVGKLLGLADITTVSPDTRQTLKNAALDLALRPVPIPRGERCGLSVCRWINAIYGLTHTHSQLNDATHNEIGDIFGIADLTSLEHIGLTMVRHRLVNSKGQDTYLTDANVAKLTMPVHFLAGDLNYIFRPKGTRESIAFLSAKNPAIAAQENHRYYTADYYPTYAHLDTMVGRNAVRDVYPDIVKQLGRFPIDPAPPAPAPPAPAPTPSAPPSP